MERIIGILALLIGLFAGVYRALPQSDSAHIRSGAKVFLEKMEGFEDNFLAALHAKQVPVVVVTDREKADFFFSGYCHVFGDNSIEANVKAVNQDGFVVFAYDYVEKYPLNGKKSAAEACAKNLKKKILIR